MDDGLVEPELLASRGLPFTPQPWPIAGGGQWVIYSNDGMQAAVLNPGFDSVRRFDFSEQLSGPERFARRTIRVSPDGTTAVGVRWPDVIVQIGDQQHQFLTPPGDIYLASAPLVLDDACFIVQPPAELTDNNEIDDHLLVKLDLATGDFSPVAPIPTHGDYVVLGAGADLVVVATDGQHGSETAGIDRLSGQSTFGAELGVDTEHHWLARGGEMYVARLGIDQFSPDRNWCVSGGDQVTIAVWPSLEVIGQWKPADQRHLLYPIILGPERVAVWEVDTSYLTVLDPSHPQHPIGRVQVADRHQIVDANEDRFVTVKKQTAYLWSVDATT